MVEIADIKDRDSLEVWLQYQPREVSVWISSRIAMRILPQCWAAVLTEDWLHGNDVNALPIMRSLLISSVAAFRPKDLIRAAAEKAGAVSAGYKCPRDLTAAPAAAANAAAAAFAPEANFLSSALCVPDNATSYRAAFAADDSWQAIRTDAEQAGTRPLPDALPLWPYGENPLEKDWSDINASVANAPDAADWQFWIDWYDAQLSGRTMLPDPKRTWDMLEQIALIDPATWDAGPETVNPIIREIWKLHHLRSEVAVMQAEKEAFLAARASRAQRSHNLPPEGLVDDQPELAHQITIVWDSLDEAWDALDQDTPDKGWLRAIAERLLSALTAIGQYCAKVADTTVMSAAKVGGPVGVTTLIDHLANNGRLMQFAKDLFTFGAGG